MNLLTPSEVVGFAAEIMKKKCCYTTRQTLLLGFLAGAYVGIGGFSANVASFDIVSVSSAKFMYGAVFPVGLILVILAGGELFTGNCLTTLGLFNKSISVPQIFKNLVLVYFANFLGAVFFAWLIWQTGMVKGGIAEAAIKVATTKSALPFWEAFLRGIICNWLVSLAVWVSFSAKDVAGKIMAMWFPIMVFAMGGYEHSIANMYFIPLGIFIEGGATLSWGGLVNNLIPVTIGNLAGAGVFVAGIYGLTFGESLKK